MMAAYFIGEPLCYVTPPRGIAHWIPDPRGAYRETSQSGFRAGLPAAFLGLRSALGPGSSTSFLSLSCSHQFLRRAQAWQIVTVPFHDSSQRAKQLRVRDMATIPG